MKIVEIVYITQAYTKRLFVVLCGAKSVGDANAEFS